MKKYIIFTCTLFAQILLVHSYASDTEQYIEVGKLETSITLGFGGIENPIQGAENINSVFLPHLAYYGENWYFDDFTFGYSLYQGEKYYLDAVGTFNEDGFFFELDGVDKLFAVNSFRELERPGRPQPQQQNGAAITRSISYQGGLTFGYADNGWGVELSVLHDVSAAHHGMENKLASYYVTPLFGGQLLTQLGVTHKSRELIEYYYDFRASEVSLRMSPNPLGGSAFNYHAKIQYRFPLSAHFSVLFSISNTWLDSELRRSAMFKKAHYVKGFSGVTYVF